MTTKVLDARNMMPPEPLELALSSLDDLGQNDEIILLLPREPIPLYAILRKNGYRYSVREQEDGSFAVSITHQT